jgi:hypothetical protein
MFYLCSHWFSDSGARRIELNSSQNRIIINVSEGPMPYRSPMHLSCLFGRHRPMLNSIITKEHGFAALCDDCGAPIERRDDGRWIHCPALISDRNQPA